MFATALIVFREALEAALVIGIVLAASRGLPRRALIASGGVLLGVLGAIVIAALAGVIANAAQGIGQELLNATILGSAVLMLGWHNIWMAQHAQTMTTQLKTVGEDVATGHLPEWMLGSVIALAVLREGAEIVLFLYGIALNDTQHAMLLGGAGGLLAGAAMGVLLYFGMLRIPLRYFFTVTSAMILLLASGLAAQCAGFLVQAGVIPAFGEQLWDTSNIVSEQSLTGQVLHAIMGYVARPAGIQVVFFFVTLYSTGALMLYVRRRQGNLARVMAVLALVSLSVAVPSHRAEAAPFTVYSPRVVQGETELEYRGFYDRDNHDDRNTNQKHSLSVGHAFTSYWSSELYAVYENAPGESFKQDGWEWENRFQLTEPGEYWADFGLLVEYEHPAHGSTKEVALAPIIEKTIGSWVATGNLFIEREFGGDASSDLVLAYAARLKYLMNPHAEPAIEFFGEPGVIDDMGRVNHQEHWVGPALYGQLHAGNKRKFAYSTALLKGVTSAATDWRAVVRLEYEFY